MILETSAIFIDASGQKSPVTLKWNAFDVSIQERNYLYTQLKFEVGGSNDSLLFIHLENNQSLYINLDSEMRRDLLNIESLKIQFSELFKVHRKSRMMEISFITIFILIVGSLIYFRGPIAGSLSKSIPVSFEKTLADKIFKERDGDKYKSEKIAEEKLIELVKEISEYNSEKYTIHLSSDQAINAYATIGGHIFINKGLIKSLKAPEDLLGVVGHEMIHAKNRHVIKSLFQSLGLFALIQVLVGDVTGIAAVLADGGGPLLHLSYSRDLETEADVESVELMLVSRINPVGLTRALTAIELEHKKTLSESPGGEEIDKLMNQTFLRSHPQSIDRNKAIQLKIDQLQTTEKYKNIEYKDLNKQWTELQAAMSNL